MNDISQTSQHRGLDTNLLTEAANYSSHVKAQKEVFDAVHRLWQQLDRERHDGASSPEATRQAYDKFIDSYRSLGFGIPDEIAQKRVEDLNGQDFWNFIFNTFRWDVIGILKNVMSQPEELRVAKAALILKTLGENVDPKGLNEAANYLVHVAAQKELMYRSHSYGLYGTLAEEIKAGDYLPQAQQESYDRFISDLKSKGFGIPDKIVNKHVGFMTYGDFMEFILNTFRREVIEAVESIMTQREELRLANAPLVLLALSK